MSVPYHAAPIRRGNIRRAVREVAKGEGIKVRRIQYKKRIMGVVDSGSLRAVRGLWHPKGHRIQIATVQPKAKGRIRDVGELIGTAAHELAHAKETHLREEGIRSPDAPTHDFFHAIDTTHYNYELARAATRLAMKDRQYLSPEKHPGLRKSSDSWDESKHPRKPAGSPDGGEFENK